MRRLHRHARGRDGYSLVELMVAMTAGAILISSGYILTNSSSQFFHRTSRVATTQAGLRLAAEQLRADLARAGFLGHPDTNNLTQCGVDMAASISSPASENGAVRSVELSTALEADADGQQVRSDQVALTGNFVTNERYDLRPSTSLSTLVINADDPAFRRSFVSIDGSTYAATAFTRAFQAGNLVRIEVFSPRRYTFFRVIQNSSAGTLSAGSAGLVSDGSGGEVAWAGMPWVQLAQPLPNCPLRAADLEDAFVAPVSTVDYRMVDMLNLAGAEATALANLNRDVANGAAMEFALVRREWAYGTNSGAFRANSERVVLEYAVEFGLAALVCSTLGDVCNLDDLAVNTTLTGFEPSQVQGLRVTMAARTPDVDRNFDSGDESAFTRASVMTGNPLRSWSVVGAVGRGRARVRTTSFDVALMNNQQ